MPLLQISGAGRLLYGIFTGRQLPVRENERSRSGFYGNSSLLHGCMGGFPVSTALVLVFKRKTAIIPKQGCGKGESGYDQQTANAGAHGIRGRSRVGMSGCHSLFISIGPKLGDRGEFANMQTGKGSERNIDYLTTRGTREKYDHGEGENIQYSIFNLQFSMISPRSQP